MLWLIGAVWAGLKQKHVTERFKNLAEVIIFSKALKARSSLFKIISENLVCKNHRIYIGI